MLCTRLTNANIVTMDPDRPAARELGIWRGRIVGLDEAVASLPAREVVDLQGATVLPGFIDSHVHLAWTGLKQNAPSVAPCERVQDVLAAVAQATSRTEAPGDRVDVMGYARCACARPTARTASPALWTWACAPGSATTGCRSAPSRSTPMAG
ncbi:hypothetical protein STANM337S_06448 [Streptomyces tanashiensis]